MASLGELFVKLGIDTSEFQRGLGEVEKSVGGLGGLIKQAAGTALGFVGAQAAISAIGGAFDLVKSSIVGMNASLETSTLQFTTLMGDAEKARQHVEGLFRFAAETPFETGPIINASRLLQTFGGDALNSEANLRLVGDAAAAAGRDIGEVAFWVGRAYSSIQAGKPFGEAAMNLQEMGVMSATARARLEELQKSGASADEVWAAFTDELHKFDGAMKLQAGTWQGLTSTISDNIAMLSATAFKPLFDVLKQGAGAFAEFLQRPEVQQFAETLATKVASGIQQLASWITGTAIPALQQVASWAGENLLPKLQQLADWFTTTALPAIQSFLSGAWTQLQTGFSQAWTVISTQILPVFQQLADWFVANAIPAFTQIANVVATEFVPTFQRIAAEVVPSLLSFASFVAEQVAPRVQEFAQQAAAFVSETLIPAWQRIASVLLPVLEQFANWFSEKALPKIQEFVTLFLGYWDQISAELFPALEKIVEVIVAALEKIVGFVREHGDTIMAVLTGAWNVIEGVIKAVLAIIAGIITTALKLIQGDWSGAWETVKQTASTVWEAITQIIDGLLQIIKTIIRTGLDEAKRIWDSIWDGVQRKIDEIKTSVTTTVQNLISDIKGAFSGSINWLWQAGRDIVQGLINGLSSLLSEVRRKAEEIGSTVKNAVSSALQIFSPSRVMMELGELTGEGFVLGIRVSAREVEDAARQLVDVSEFGVGYPLPAMRRVGLRADSVRPVVSPAGAETRLDLTLQLDSDVVARAVVKSISSRLRLYGQLG